MLVTTYLVNLLCAVVECRGTMPLPEAYIAEYSSPVGLQVPPERVIEPTNITETFRTNSVDDESLRRKRLYPLRLNSSDDNSNRRRGFSLQSSMGDLLNTIPNFVNSVSRVMQNGNDNLGLLRFRTGRADNSGRFSAHSDAMPVVFLKNGGGVEGYYMGTMNGRKVAAFEGIPYAEPPVGNRRFKPPVPKRPWNGIIKTIKPGNTCLQTHPLYFFRVTGDENCLYLNLYKPIIPSKRDNELLPVLVFIHGGSFMYGSGSEYGPAYLLDRDVILVTFNYRLGALGFLSTGDLECSGNFGLRDQAEVLKWVNDNIEGFGGDPNRVTVSGQSAGGVSAHLHLIANKSTNYFHNGVSLSGSGFGFWPVLSKQRASRLTRSLAKRLNCPYRSSAELIRCLREISGSWIIMTQLHLFDWIPFHPLVLFAPVVEPESPYSYLTKWPSDAYSRNEVAGMPWIFGQTFKEGHFETYLLKLFMQVPNMALHVKKFLPKVLDYEIFTTEPLTSDITHRLLEFYSGSARRDGLDMDTISDMYTDRYFSNTVQQAIRAHSQLVPSKTYAYIFNFTGKYNLGELFGVPRSEWSSAHTEDVMMIFNSSSFHHGLSKRDVEYQLSEIMTNMISNFVANSDPVYQDGSNNPTKVWGDALNPSPNEVDPKIQYLQLGSSVDMVPDPYTNRVKFWNTLRIPV